MREALELEEDAYWNYRAEKRAKTFDPLKALSHEEVWKKRGYIQRHKYFRIVIASPAQQGVAIQFLDCFVGHMGLLAMTDRKKLLSPRIVVLCAVV